MKSYEVFIHQLPAANFGLQESAMLTQFRDPGQWAHELCDNPDYYLWFELNDFVNLTKYRLLEYDDYYYDWRCRWNLKADQKNNSQHF